MDLRRLLGQVQAQQNGPAADAPMVDTAETVHISSLALLKMLKHGTLLFMLVKHIHWADHDL
jgi:hypothetical protein